MGQDPDPQRDYSRSASGVGQWVIKYMPLIVLAASLVASATAAQLQIHANASGIAENKAALQLRVPTFLYDRDMEQIEEDLQEIGGSAEANEEIIQQLERGDDQIKSKIELEIERLRALIDRKDQANSAKLETILRLLEQELNSE